MSEERARILDVEGKHPHRLYWNAGVLFGLLLALGEAGKFASMTKRGERVG